MYYKLKNVLNWYCYKFIEFIAKVQGTQPQYTVKNKGIIYDFLFLKT